MRDRLLAGAQGSVRTGVRIVVTTIVLALPFVGFLAWHGTDLPMFATPAAKQEDAQLRPLPALHGGVTPHRPKHGQEFAVMRIPALDVEAGVAEGAGKHDILDKGLIGHISGAQAAFPWDKRGNFAVAGHRNTHGEPFRKINELERGDSVYVETATTRYTYEITGTLPRTAPTNTGVLAPVPAQAGFRGPGRYLTLVTCTPEFTTTYRLIVWGRLVNEVPVHTRDAPRLKPMAR